ncbi:hypothetical protein TcWFU_002659 [Taenia crassiceps]|uniref:Uncharacterized protein n=1 Tax=Taenia crassiceps TaxID=6207 RepID=A0ABR4QP83_9CEST
MTSASTRTGPSSQTPLIETNRAPVQNLPVGKANESIVDPEVTTSKEEGVSSSPTKRPKKAPAIANQRSASVTSEDTTKRRPRKPPKTVKTNGIIVDPEGTTSKEEGVSSSPTKRPKKAPAIANQRSASVTSEDTTKRRPRKPPKTVKTNGIIVDPEGITSKEEGVSSNPTKRPKKAPSTANQRPSTMASEDVTKRRSKRASKNVEANEVDLGNSIISPPAKTTSGSTFKALATGTIFASMILMAS